MSNNIKNLISLSTAGGGKTTKLISRINQIGGEMNKILVISFTNASCDDIFKRSGIKAETLHSFCYRFLPQKYTIEENLGRFTSIFLGKFFHLSQLGETTVNNLLNSFYIFKQLPKSDLVLSEKDMILNSELQELIKLIDEEKLSHNCLFFSDIIHTFKEEMEAYIYTIALQYDHILVDEAQDLSENQLYILGYLITNVFLEKNKSFFIVGDVKQSIYNFQGSSPEIYENFIKDIKNICEDKCIDLVFEKNNTTFRFGGDILTKINEKFEAHNSTKTIGTYKQIFINESKEIENVVQKIVNSHLKDMSPNNIMVLFDKNNKIIENLQNKFFNLGKNIKVYTQNNSIIDGLKDIVCFLQTKNQFYVAKILQGPFFHLNEPHFFFLNEYVKDLTRYNSEFFLQIETLRFFPDLLISFLISKDIFANFIDGKLLKIIYEMSFSYTSIDSLILNIPNTIKVYEEGIQFSTLHSSKGLEADVVIMLPKTSNKNKLTINLKPFFFFSDNINEFTQYIVDLQFKDNKINEKNLHYVGLTRAKKYLYEINYSNLW